jgi:Tfp pilus assembly PilM family ATPase
MFTKSFFKLFPPPKFLNIPYAGLDISDEAIRCIEYTHSHHGYTISKFGSRALQAGVIEEGRIKDEKALMGELAVLIKDLKITTVKASLPEERMYLFKTEVPSMNEDQIRQNIEFKLEENVPLATSEAVFFFDLLPDAMKSAGNRNKSFVSVSVAPRELVNSYLKVLQASSLTVVSFEIQAKAIARAVVSPDSTKTELIIHVMSKKTGLYVVSHGVVCFTSTISWGGDLMKSKSDADVSDAIFSLRHEIERVYSYWSQKGEGQPIQKIVMSGHDAELISQISHISPNNEIPLQVANIWQNVFSNHHYVPPIPFEESLDYAIAAGLAFP